MILFTQIVYCVIILILVPALISMEYYARKSKVCAAPSVPWMRKAVIERLRQEVKGLSMATPLILELGSGWGTLALSAAKACPHAHVQGYEISPVPLFFSRLRAFVRRQKNTHFAAQDFFDINIREADVILTYLTQPLMEKLRVKFDAELKPGSVVICNTFPTPGWLPDEEETIQNFVYTLKVYTYRIKDKAT